MPHRIADIIDRVIANKERQLDIYLRRTGAIGEKESVQGEIRKLFDEMVEDPVKLQAWMDQMKGAGLSPKEINGWLSHQAVLKMRREG